MKLKISAEDCIKWIEYEYHIELFPFQKEIIQAWFDGKSVATGRGCGRSFLTRLIRAYFCYVTDIWDLTNLPPSPDCTFDSTYAVAVKLLDEDFYNRLEKEAPPSYFDKEFKCIY